MAHIVSDNTFARPQFGFGKITSFFGHVSEAWKMQARIRTTMHELSSLSDAELSDLGIARVNIPSIALEAATQENS